MIGKTLTAAIILGVFMVAKVQSIPQYQPQLGIPSTNRPYASNSLVNLESTTPIPIVSQSGVNNADGSFNFSYESGNGIKQQSTGFLKKISVPLLRADGTQTGEQQETDILVHTGSYSYTAPDGTVITLNYVSDENGFQPVGDHLPTPPPIPDHVLAIIHQTQQQDNQNQLVQPQVQPAIQSNNFGRHTTGELQRF